MLRQIDRFFSELEGDLFDFMRGIKTSKIHVKNENLKTSSIYKDNASGYQAVWCSSLRILIKEARIRGYKDCTFLDIGCGMGKACFFVSCKSQFSKIIGVDFDSNLVDIANKNLKSFKGLAGKDDISFILGDAAFYKLAAEKILIFMFNPFDEIVMKRFLDNNLNVLINHQCAIAYSNDIHKTVLKECGMKCVFSDNVRKLSLWVF